MRTSRSCCLPRLNCLFRIFWILLTVLFFSACQRAQKPSEEKPNFVWIISEDNSKHYLKLFDPNGISTPHIEKMAQHGISFTHAFSNAPVCSVARSALESSCYGPRTGAQFHRKSKLVPLPEGLDMFPSYLRKAGYYTSNRAKKDYNYIEGDRVWDESSNQAHWSKRSAGQPFFHKESHPVSHESQLHFKAELMERYQPQTDPEEVQLFPNHPDTELFRFTAAYYRDKILAVDSIVGRVLAQLEEDGLLESTFVFYFGDHGGVLPGSKGYAYETGLHIPLVVRVPEKFRHLVDHKQGSACNGFVSFVDFGPTLLQLAGVELPEQIDGKPFLGPGISAKQVEHQQVAYGYADRFDEKYDLVRTVRKGPLKYMRSYQPFNADGLQNNYRYKCLAFQQWRDLFRKGELNDIQSGFFRARDPEALYDLRTDPFETINLAKLPEYRDELLEMRSLLGKWVRGMPDLSFYPEPVLRNEAFDNPVEFGQIHQEAISALVDIADLSLLPYGEARAGIRSALQSGDPLKLYWGLIVCSCFGEEAMEFVADAKTLCTHEDLGVRTRAAEFLGLTGKGDPVPVITEALKQSEDGIEALLILNTLVLLMDGPYGYEFELSERDLKQAVRDEPQVQRRLEYLDARAGQAKKL